MANTVSVVIPTYGQWQHTHQLLSDVRQWWKPDEVIILDDDSPDDDTLNGCAFWKGILPVVYACNDHNRGFLLTANRGISLAKGDIVICMNNDVRLRPRAPESSISVWDYIKNSTNDDCVVGGALLGPSGWNVFGDRVYPYLEGWMLSATKENWGIGFDERFAPGDYEDVDKSTEWLNNGIQLQPLPNGSMVHLGAKSYGYTPERQARTERNRELFAEKWNIK